VGLPTGTLFASATPLASTARLGSQHPHGARPPTAADRDPAGGDQFPAASFMCATSSTAIASAIEHRDCAWSLQSAPPDVRILDLAHKSAATSRSHLDVRPASGGAIPPRHRVSSRRASSRSASTRRNTRQRSTSSGRSLTRAGQDPDCARYSNQRHLRGLASAQEACRMSDDARRGSSRVDSTSTTGHGPARERLRVRRGETVLRRREPQSGHVRACTATPEREAKYVTVLTGRGARRLGPDQRLEEPRSRRALERFVLSASTPAVLFVPAGHANGFMSLTEDAGFVFSRPRRSREPG